MALFYHNGGSFDQKVVNEGGLTYIRDQNILTFKAFQDIATKELLLKKIIIKISVFVLIGIGSCSSLLDPSVNLRKPISVKVLNCLVDGHFISHW